MDDKERVSSSFLTPLNIVPLCVYALTTQMITDGPTVGILPVSFLFILIKSHESKAHFCY